MKVLILVAFLHISWLTEMSAELLRNQLHYWEVSWIAKKSAELLRSQLKTTEKSAQLINWDISWKTIWNQSIDLRAAFQRVRKSFRPLFLYQCNLQKCLVGIGQGKALLWNEKIVPIRGRSSSMANVTTIPRRSNLTECHKSSPRPSPVTMVFSVKPMWIWVYNFPFSVNEYNDVK